MINRINKNVLGVIFITLSLLLLSGCISVKATKTGTMNENTTVLMMPTHDLVQGGQHHIKADGSGRQFQHTLGSELEMLGNINVKYFPVTDSINHNTIISRDVALEEAAKAGAQYCLMTSLGEFRNAAPMTFRADFASISSGALLDVNTGRAIWTLDKTYRLEKSNLGNHLGLVDTIAHEIAQSIAK